MDKTIKLSARERIKNWLEHLEDKTYLLHSQYDNVRCGIDPEDSEVITFVDPPGGPFIAVGHKLLEANAKVKSIEHISGKGFAITFE